MLKSHIFYFKNFFLPNGFYAVCYHRMSLFHFFKRQFCIFVTEKTVVSPLLSTFPKTLIYLMPGGEGRDWEGERCKQA